VRRTHVNYWLQAACRMSSLAGVRKPFPRPGIGRGVALLLTAVSVVASGFHGGPCSADEPALEREFTLKLLPLLKSRCYGCHGDDPQNVRGELDVRSREKLLRGGESGEPAIVPGNPEASLLYQAVRWDGLEMPPKENDRLTDEEIRMLHRWIQAGAAWPDEKRQRQIREEERRQLQTADGVLVRTSGGQSDEWTDRRYQPEDLWAFRSLQAVSVPDGQHPVDHLIRKRLADSI
jgi:mono/diheme cytochrome c family protein